MNLIQSDTKEGEFLKNLAYTKIVFHNNSTDMGSDSRGDIQQYLASHNKIHSNQFSFITRFHHLKLVSTQFDIQEEIS